MKKLLLILLLPLVITSCATPTYTIGMTEAEFTSHQKLITSLVEKTAHHTVYRRVAEADINAQPTRYQYFYFVDGKLTRIDEGQRAPDIIVEHR